jgi:trans-aconitate methyltransferase
MVGAQMARKLPPRLELAASLLESRPGPILEIGCGPGKLLRHLASMDGEADLVGIDRSATMISAAREQLRELIECRRVRLFCHALENEPIASFSTLVAVDVNAFWTRSSKAFAALDQWMKSDAHALLVFSAPGRSKLDQIRQTIVSSEWLGNRRIQADLERCQGEGFVAVRVGP